MAKTKLRSHVIEAYSQFLTDTVDRAGLFQKEIGGEAYDNLQQALKLIEDAIENMKICKASADFLTSLIEKTAEIRKMVPEHKATVSFLYNPMSGKEERLSPGKKNGKEKQKRLKLVTEK